MGNHTRKKEQTLFITERAMELPILEISLLNWIQLMGHISAGRGVSSTDLVGCVSSLENLEPKGAVPQALTLLGGARLSPGARGVSF